MSNPKRKPIVCKSRFRIKLEDQIALGPGKVDLLEAIERTGSISQAARELNLSYRRAWDLVDTMNRCFKTPLVSRTTGGKHGGGARLTALGKRMTTIYRTMESKAAKATQPELKSIKRSLKST